MLSNDDLKRIGDIAAANGEKRQWQTIANANGVVCSNEVVVIALAPDEAEALVSELLDHRARVEYIRADANRLYDVLDRIHFDTCQSGPLHCPTCDRDTLLEGHTADCELMAALRQHEALRAGAMTVPPTPQEDK